MNKKKIKKKEKERKNTPDPRTPPPKTRTPPPPTHTQETYLFLENLSTMQNNQFVRLKINLADHWEIRLRFFSVCIKGYSRTCI